MRSLLRQLTAAVLIAVGVAMVVAPTAVAAPIGTFLVIPGDSSDLTAIRLRTSSGCPEPSDAYNALMFGRGFPAEGIVVTGTTSAGMSRTAGFDVYLAQTMRDFADLNGGVVLAGRYDIVVSCVDSFTQVSSGEFVGAIEFSSPTQYVAVGGARPLGTPPEPRPLGEAGSTAELGALPEAGGTAPPLEGVVPLTEGTAPGQAGSLPDDAAAQPGVQPAGRSSDDGGFLPALVAVLVIVPVVWIIAYVAGRRRAGKG